MTGLTGLFRRGSTYYMRVVLPVNHPLRSDHPNGRIVVSLRSSNYRDALTKGVTKRAEILGGCVLKPPSKPSLDARVNHGYEQPLNLRDLHQRWLASKSISADSSSACLRAIALFEKCVGENVNLLQLSRGMGDMFRAWLQQQPTSSKTARDRLVWIKGLLNYAAIDLELIPRNPWRGLEIKSRTEAPRQPWSTENLQRLLSSPVWQKGHLPNHKKAGGSAAYWLPLLGLYTGARCSELCQLTTKDILQDGGVWVIRVSDMQPSQQVKSDASRRIIPLHAEILRLGFIEYWKSLKSNSLWPELPKREGKAGGFFSQYFGALRTLCEIPDHTGFHSFRHSVRSSLLAAGVAESIIDRLLGHESSGGIGGKVYTHLTPQTLQSAINSLPVVTSGVVHFSRLNASLTKGMRSA